MSLVERLKKLLATEEVEEEGEEGLEKAAKDVNTQSGSEDDKPKLVRKQITLGARPINVDLSKEVKRFNE